MKDLKRHLVVVQSYSVAKSVNFMQLTNKYYCELGCSLLRNMQGAYCNSTILDLCIKTESVAAAPIID